MKNKHMETTSAALQMRMVSGSGHCQINQKTVIVITRADRIVRFPKCWGYRERFWVKSGNTAVCGSSPTLDSTLAGSPRSAVLIQQPSVMEMPLVATAKCEIRAVIRFLNAKKVAAIETHRQLTEVYGEKSMSVQHVRKWCREFTGGRTDIHDEERSGGPSVSDETIEKVEGILHEDRRITIRELALRVPEFLFPQLRRY